jgi:hypothetical protein
LYFLAFNDGRNKAKAAAGLRSATAVELLPAVLFVERRLAGRCQRHIKEDSLFWRQF